MMRTSLFKAHELSDLGIFLQNATRIGAYLHIYRTDDHGLC